MSKVFLTSIDLRKNQLIGARVENLGTAPASPAVGQIYFDTTGGLLRLFVWDGTAWQRASFLTDPFARANHTGTQVAATISDFDAQVRTSRLDQLAAPIVSVNANNQKIIGVANGTSPSDAVNRSQLDAISSGLDVKASVRATSTGAVTVTYTATGGTSARGQITAAPNALDGVALAANDRLFLKDQAVAAQNGLWVVTTVGAGTTGVWDRAPDFDADAEVTGGAFTFVTEGTVNSDSGWVLTTNDPIVIGGASGSALAWAQFSGAGSITAGAGILKTGNTLDIGQGSGIIVSADSIAVDSTYVTRKYAVAVGDGTALSYVITHNLNTQDVVVAVYISTGTFEEVLCDTEHTSVNTITLRFAVAPTAGQYRVIVHG